MRDRQALTNEAEIRGVRVRLRKTLSTATSSR